MVVSLLISPGTLKIIKSDFSWCMHYDTIYGMMDRADDVKVGIGSTALLFGNYARPILSGFCVVFVASLCVLGMSLHTSWAYYLIAVVAPSVHLIWQLLTDDFDDNRSCFTIFTSNSRHVGYLVWFGLLLEYYRNM
jgi:4-hydroxybenzoate polyprenyltransferase